MTVYAITNTKKGEQGLRLLIFKLPISFQYYDCYYTLLYFRMAAFLGHSVYTFIGLYN